MLPLLKVSGDENEHSSKEVVEPLAEFFQLSEEERRRLLPSKILVFYDRTHWALSYLKGAGLLIATRRGYFRITDRGIDVLNKNPARIDVKFLRQFPEFIEYISYRKKRR